MQAWTLYAREPGEPGIHPYDVTDRSGKICDHNPDVYVSGKSDVGNSTSESVEQSQLTGSGDGGGKDR